MLEKTYKIEAIFRNWERKVINSGFGNRENTRDIHGLSNIQILLFEGNKTILSNNR